ncbi:MAG: Lrp/AsnC ligand binding domain-containing protein [Desulfobacterales bacterium]|nr:Lrp/AsnC ligand binding domain-containing protein [Desulfobacterales bacterium]
MPGKEVSIRDSMRGIKGVEKADVVTGHYDVIAVIEAQDTNEIFSKVLQKIRGIKGINRTETFVAIE